jgi:hypothetical protein
MKLFPGLENLTDDNEIEKRTSSLWGILSSKVVPSKLLDIVSNLGERSGFEI